MLDMCISDGQIFGYYQFQNFTISLISLMGQINTRTPES